MPDTTRAAGWNCRSQVEKADRPAQIYAAVYAPMCASLHSLKKFNRGRSMATPLAYE